MNLLTDTIYAGLAGVRLHVDSFELGHGLRLDRTYSHFMAPFIMAFALPEVGQPHPGPWKSVDGGMAIDIQVQLTIPDSFALSNFFDRLNTAWWITALTRLRAAPRAHMPVIANRAFGEIPLDSDSASILPVEVQPRRLAASLGTKELGADDLLWIQSVWIQGGRLMDSSKDFNAAFQALDSASAMPTKDLAMLTMWGALERLFSPSNSEIRFRVAVNIASYLEPPGAERKELARRIKKLYDARSSVAHGRELNSPDSWMETQSLAGRILIQMLDRGKVPTQDDLDDALFSSGI